MQDATFGQCTQDKIPVFLLPEDRRTVFPGHLRQRPEQAGEAYLLPLGRLSLTSTGKELTHARDFIIQYLALGAEALKMIVKKALEVE